MGYTHHWHVMPDVHPRKFAGISADFIAMQPVLAKINVRLSGSDSNDTPEIGSRMIFFNGITEPTKKDRMGIIWPKTGDSDEYGRRILNAVQSVHKSESRFNSNAESLSHETFVLEQATELDGTSRDGMAYGFCKTNHKPYDIAVQMALIIAKHHLKNDILVHTDGENDDWDEPRALCREFLEYGGDFIIDELTDEEQ